MFCFFFKWLFDSFLFLNNFDDGVLSSRKLFFIKMLQQTIAESVELVDLQFGQFPPRSDTLMCPGVSAILSSHTLFSVGSLSLILVSFPTNVNI